MDAASILALLKAAVPGVVAEPGPAGDQPAIVLGRECLRAVCRCLRDDPGLRFDALVDVIGVDWWPREPRYEVVYHLVSAGAETPSRLRLVVRLPADDAHLPSVTGVWASAGWLEREVWDLFGIVFDGHGDLRRLLLPEEWEGYPLRKDYPVQVGFPPKVDEPLNADEQDPEAGATSEGGARGGPAGEAGRGKAGEQ